MPRKNFPFAITPRTKITSVGDLESGIFYLLRKGSITPKENPINQQEIEIQAAKTQISLMRAVSRLAEKENISKTAARQKLFNTKLKRAEDGQDSAIATVDDDSADDGLTMYDYLEESEALELISLSTKNNEFDVKVGAVTLFIKFRMLFPIKLAQETEVNSNEIKVEEIPQNLDVGTKIKFGKTYLVVSEYAEAGSELISVQTCPTKLMSESVGFICEKDSRKELVGIDKYEEELQIEDGEKWNEDTTKEFLTLKQIDDIFTFYQKEAGVNIAELTNKEDASDTALKDEGELSPNLRNTSQEAQSNGQKSGFGSTSSDVDSKNSKGGKVLATNPS